MKKSLAPALMAAFLTSATVPASAAEGMLDGIVYSLPEDTGFITPAGSVTEHDSLQAVVDEQRRVVPADKSMIEFSIAPLSADAAKRGMDIVLVREAAPPTEGMLALRGAMEGARFEEGIAKLDSAKLLGQAPGTRTYAVLLGQAPGTRTYAVQTGLAFAPEVIATCAIDMFTKGDRCTVRLERPERRKLSWTGVRLTEFDPRVMRHEIAELIEKTLPVEAEKSREGEPASVPTASSVSYTPALEGTVDGTVYAAPAGSVFRRKGGDMLMSDGLQAAVDERRMGADPDRPLVLFTTHPVPWGGRDRQSVLEVSALPASFKDATDLPEMTCAGVKPAAGVSCLDTATVRDIEAMPGARSYRVSTGLPFAKNAYVLCVDEMDGRECEVKVRRDRIMMSWSRVIMDDGDAGTVRNRVRALVSEALPREAAKAK